MTSRWLGLGAGAVGLVAGLIAYVADARSLALVAALAAAVAGVVALVGGPLVAGGAPVPPPGRPAAPPPSGPTLGAAARTDDRDLDDEASPFIDAETGLFTSGFFAVAVASRISAARRHLRPVSVVLLEARRGPDDDRPVHPVILASALEDTVREGDTACRLAGDRIGLVLEDTAEDGALVLLDRLRARLAELAPDACCSAGIACYPTHAFNAADVRAKVAAALTAARTSPDQQVQVATGD